MSNAGIATNAAGTKGQLTFGGAVVAEFDGNGIDPAGLKAMVPAFRVAMSTAQSINNGTATKLVFNTKQVDTNTFFDATTNYRFQPTVAGYYLVSVGVATPLSGTGVSAVYIYKTGVRASSGAISNNVAGLVAVVSDLVFLNGSTDYVEAWGYQSTGASANMGSTGGDTSWFSGCLVRAA